MFRREFELTRRLKSHGRGYKHTRYKVSKKRKTFASDAENLYLGMELKFGYLINKALSVFFRCFKFFQGFKDAPF
jgi:hypothetical protein